MQEVRATLREWAQIWHKLFVVGAAFVWAGHRLGASPASGSLEAACMLGGSGTDFGACGAPSW